MEISLAGTLLMFIPILTFLAICYFLFKYLVKQGRKD
jgi:hypothetical protein